MLQDKLDIMTQVKALLLEGHGDKFVVDETTGK